MHFTKKIEKEVLFELFLFCGGIGSIALLFQNNLLLTLVMFIAWGIGLAFWHKKVDVVVLSEGYAQNDRDKFKKDIERIAKIFFDQEPFKSHESKFNFYGAFKPSSVSGISEPRAGIHKKTTLNATFNSLNSERYVLTEDNKSM